MYSEAVNTKRKIQEASLQLISILLDSIDPSNKVKDLDFIDLTANFLKNLEIALRNKENEDDLTITFGAVSGSGEVFFTFEMMLDFEKNSKTVKSIKFYQKND